MQPLDSLIRTAAADAATLDPGSAPRSIGPAASPGETEVARIMQICNACRYCEGFCAVFPAMTRRLEFLPADSHYLANLCHNCGACYHACQYAPPHAFVVNVPRALAVVRLQTYTEHAWPAAFGTLYKKNGLTVALAVAAGLVLFLLLAAAGTAPLLQSQPGVGFYGVFSHRFMANLFGVVFGFAVLALGIGVRRFWRSVSPGAPTSGTALAAGAEAAGHALALTYLGGGHGAGCNEADDRFTLARRRFHHLTFYGFMLCFAATSVATLYHYVLHQPAPYALTSLPVVLGTAGGIGLVIGPAGLLWLNWRRDPVAGDPAQKPMDRGFIALLLLISISGLALLAWRETRAMPLLLITHLGVVMALFLTMPYSKFAHGFYRCAALLKSSIEKRQPSRLQLGAD